MPVGIHVVRLSLCNVDQTGAVIKKDDPGTTVKTMMTADTEIRVLADAGVSNSASNPTVKAYLEAEAADDYVLKYIDQNLIVTYNQADLNNAT